MHSNRIVTVLIVFTSIGSIKAINKLCESQVKYFEDELKLGAIWAKIVQDSWGNLPISGTYSGNKFDFGQFDQCIDFTHESKVYGNFAGRYCIIFVPSEDVMRMNENTNSILIQIEPKMFPPSRSLDKDLGFGVCLPDSCSPEDIRDIVNLQLRTTKNLSVSSTYNQELFCSKFKPDDNGLSKLQISAL